MAYDKNSFLSGVAVGKQLKGWGRAQPDEPKPRMLAEFLVVPSVAITAVESGVFPETPTATLEVE